MDKAKTVTGDYYECRRGLARLHRVALSRIGIEDAKISESVANLYSAKAAEGFRKVDHLIRRTVNCRNDQVVSAVMKVATPIVVAAAASAAHRSK